MYKHLSREERYQIHSLLKANHTISEIARLLGRSRSTISRELNRGRGQRGYRAEQACRKAAQRAQRSRNARRVSAQVWGDVVFYLGLQWSPEQIAQKVAVSHESVYLRVYADKAAGGKLHQNLRSQNLGANAIYTAATDAGKSPTDARSASGQAILKSASR
ncbi:IS30 family transposase [Acidovorax temperans]|nr:helix-turn-helix domain-containing protein [Acidovorax temperans]MBO0940502.1 IS30 family transposase [Acidovorax temperans]